MTSSGKDVADMRPVAVIHHKAADVRAHRLFAYSSATWAREWIAPANDAFQEDLLEFAFHAYRLCEIVGINQGAIDVSDGGTIMFNGEPDYPFETDYRNCLNLLRHAVSFKLGSVNSNRKLFSQNENKQCAFAIVSTDRFELRTVPIFALSFAHLHAVRPILANFFNRTREAYLERHAT